MGTEKLKAFFSGYFHQDWSMDALTPDEVVAQYARDAGAEERAGLAREIASYAKTVSGDAELDKRLFDDLGSYFIPGHIGMSAHQWLQSIADQLLKADDRV
jgi:contact-dependent growth inhibition (CDI) system CdiI-like immunity protein